MHSGEKAGLNRVACESGCNGGYAKTFGSSYRIFYRRWQWQRQWWCTLYCCGRGCENNASANSDYAAASALDWDSLGNAIAIHWNAAVATVSKVVEHIVGRVAFRDGVQEVEIVNNLGR